MDSRTLERIRKLCLRFPETSERLSHGEPTWFVRQKKSFASLADQHHDDRVALWLAAPEGAQEALIGFDAERFFRPPYVGHRGWLGIYLDVPIDWPQLGELIEEAYRSVAPKRLVATLDDSPSAR